jgi:hypothetical protein
VYDNFLPVTGAAGVGGVAFMGGPVWVALAAFAVIATGTAVARIVPRGR